MAVCEKGGLQAVGVWTGLEPAGWGFPYVHLRAVPGWEETGMGKALPKVLSPHFRTNF